MKTFLHIALSAVICGPIFAGGLPDTGYVAHEWGTFTSVQGSDGTVLRWNSLAVSKLPPFVYARNHPFNDPSLDQQAMFFWGKSASIWLQRMETPVIYFYSKQEQHVDVQVDFPKGLVTEWYPQVTDFGPHPAMSGIMSQASASTIKWSGLTILPAQSGKYTLPGADSGNHYFTARVKEASAVRTTQSLGGRAAGEYEKFLFYRGVGNFTTPLTVSFNADGTTVYMSNTSSENLKHLFLLQVKKGKAVFSPLDELASGKNEHRPAMAMPDNTPVELTSIALSRAMKTALEEEGLFPSEASAMVETWKDSWFEEEGTRVLYVMPRSWTDSILPAKFSPAPRELVRVMVGRAEVFSPGIENKLMKAFTCFSNPETRATGLSAIHDLKLGRFLEPAIARLSDLKAQEVRTEVARFGYASERPGDKDDALALR